jgi:heat shock protein HtpX
MPIFKNTIKTSVLLAGLGGLIVTIAGVLGGGSSSSLTFGLLIAFVMVGGSYWFSDKLALKSAKARIVTEEDAPLFFGMVKELTERAGMPMPRVAIAPNEQPNAFATGRNPRHAVVCATEGLLRSMPEDELRGVMAHELMHVKHRDILISTIAATMAGAISALANMAMLFGSRGSDGRSGNPIAGILVAILAPMAAGLIQMSISRAREYEADRGGAEIAQDPEALASALDKIHRYASGIPFDAVEHHPETAQMMIMNPLTASGLSQLFSTHPATADRVARLMEMARTGSYPG